MAHAKTIPLSGADRTVQQLEAKLTDHENHLCTLSTEELIRLYQIFAQERPTMQFLFHAIQEALRFLDYTYAPSPDAQVHIVDFLEAFQQHCITQALDKAGTFQAGLAAHQAMLAAQEE